MLQPRNHPLLRSLGVVVWLTANEEVIWERVSRNQNRPLLQTKDPRATISNLMSARYPLYRSVADITVETSGLTHQEVADRAVAAIRVWSAGQNEDRQLEHSPRTADSRIVDLRELFRLLTPSNTFPGSKPVTMAIWPG